VSEGDADLVSVVAIPEDVFREILRKLAAQPYREVGGLMQVLSTYKPQRAKVERG